jgi:hypothetical protein
LGVAKRTTTRASGGFGTEDVTAYGIRPRALAGPYPVRVEFEFDGEVIWWKGPSPFHFVPVPDEESAHIEAAKSLVTYGWGVIPVTASIGETEFTTSLFPKDGRFLVPVKDAVRRAERVELGDVVTVHLTIDI